MISAHPPAPPPYWPPCLSSLPAPQPRVTEAHGREVAHSLNTTAKKAPDNSMVRTAHYDGRIIKSLSLAPAFWEVVLPGRPYTLEMFNVHAQRSLSLA
jgi:hypothetical protein